MLERASGSNISGAAFRNESMDVRIPFQITPESVKNAYEARSKVFGFVSFEKHSENNVPNR